MRRSKAESALRGQVEAATQWIHARLRGLVPWLEAPVQRVADDGELVIVRADLLIKDKGGWILLDYKSTRAGPGQWGTVADLYAGQLAAYRAVLEAASGEGVTQTWLVLPVAGAVLRVTIERASPGVG